MTTIFGRQPVVVQTLILAIINAVAIFSAWNPDDVQLGAINAVVAAVLGFITHQVVTPLADPRNSAGEALTPGPPGT